GIDVSCPNCNKKRLNNIRISEDYSGTPQSIYALTKKTQEDMWRIFAEIKSNIKVISLRYFSVYDTECNPNNPYTGVLSIIANKAINSEEIILNEDGTQTRDLIHTLDIGQAHIKATQIDLKNNFEA